MFHKLTIWFRKYFLGLRTWQDAVTGCSTPKQVCRRTKENLFLWSDIDEKSRPVNGEIVWKMGRADTYDFSQVIMELCKRVGILCELRSYHSGDGKIDRTVCVGVWEGKYWFGFCGDYHEVDTSDELAGAVIKAVAIDPLNISVILDDYKRNINEI